MSQPRFKPLKGLIVDDRQADRKRIIQGLGGPKVLAFEEFSSPDEIRFLDPRKDFKVCIADDRFNKQSCISELVGLLQAKWPGAIKIIVSAFAPKDFESFRGRVDGTWHKRQLFRDPASCRRELADWLSLASGINPERRDAVVEYLRKLDPDYEDDEFLRPRKELVLQLTGYVSEVRAPDIEVIVEEPGANGGAHKRLTMPYALFRAVGILGEGMRFRYCMSREGSRIISEVLPDDSGLGPREVPPSVRADLDRMDEIEEAERQRLKKDWAHE